MGVYVLLSVISLVLLQFGRARAFANSNSATFTGYLFAFFTGEGLRDGETISLAVSTGNDPATWIELNGGRPPLTSTVGTRGVRDPSIIRAHDGSKFWIIATDLKMYGGGDWGQAGRTGSRSIVIWESDNLRKWSAPRLAEVSPSTVGNTWAPEAIWDPQKEAYMVFWSSSLYPSNDISRRSPSYHRIMRSMTTDFIHFSPAEIWIDAKYSVIDTCVYYDQRTSKYYRFSKDERDGTPNAKFIFEESSETLSGHWKSIKEGIGKGAIARGEGPTIFPSNTVPGKWHLFIDEWGGRGYVPFETADIASGNWKPSANYKLPKKPRHGSVIPITESERQALLAPG